MKIRSLFITIKIHLLPQCFKVLVEKFCVRIGCSDREEEVDGEDKIGDEMLRGLFVIVIDCTIL